MQKHLKIFAKVKPNSSFNKIENISFDIESNLHLTIHVTATPENNKANNAVIKLLAKWLGVSQSSVEIIRGHTSRNKIIIIHGMNHDAFVLRDKTKL